MRRETTRRGGFTLIELLTVMAIIVLLIGILTPALSGARNRATKTAIQAQINAMAVGLEAFKNDEGEYPPSNPVLMTNDILNPDQEMLDWEVGTPTSPLQGAHLLKDALVGRDNLGYDPRPTNGAAGAGNYNRWAVTNDRREPYITVDGVSLTSDNEPPEDGFGIIENGNGEVQRLEGTGDQLLTTVFRDKFGWPFLYYRADPKSNQNTPIIQTELGNSTLFGDGVYDGYDNFAFTSYDPPMHRIERADERITILQGTPPAPGPPLNVESLEEDNPFAEFIRSFRGTTFDSQNPQELVWPRPVNSDRFIILSAGKDGNYGTLDDVANFAVFSKER